MKIGIIGSSGYLGSNLSLYLKKKHTIKKFSSYKKLKKKWVMTVCKEIKNFEPNIIINCSASQILNDDSKSIEKIIYSNLYAQTIFLNEAKKKVLLRGLLLLGQEQNTIKVEIIIHIFFIQHQNMLVILYYNIL